MTKRRLKQLMLLLMFLSATDGWASPLHHKVFSLSAVPASIKKQTLNTIDAGLHWEDKAGEHLALFSSSRSKTNTVTLTAQHFSIVEGQPHLVRAIKEVRACPEFDNVTHLSHHPLVSPIWTKMAGGNLLYVRDRLRQ